MKKIFITIAVVFTLFFICRRVVFAHFTCAWSRNGGGFETICEGPDIHSDAITNSESMSFCQIWQDDSDYRTCPTKKIRWRQFGPRGQICTSETNLCDCNDRGCKTISNGCGCPGQSRDCDTTTAARTWDFAECTKCKAANITWVDAQQKVIIKDIQAQNWHPRLDRVGNDTKINWTNPQTLIDFRIQILENGVAMKGLPGADANGNINIMHGDSHIACRYNTNDTYSTREANKHYITCALNAYEITGINFQAGKTYQLKTWVKSANYGESGWKDYEYTGPTTRIDSNCINSFTMPQPPLVCQNLYTNVTTANLGDTILLTCEKNAAYTDTVTYDFMLIKKDNAAAPDPNPSPTPFMKDSPKEMTNYTFPVDQYGYYLFMCRVCAGGTCTDWQRPGSVAATPTPTPGGGGGDMCLGNCVPSSECPLASRVPGGTCLSGSMACCRPIGASTSTPTPTPTSTTCRSGQTRPYYKSVNGVCTQVNSCGVSSCDPLPPQL
jgi:hypothetical protein